MKKLTGLLIMLLMATGCEKLETVLGNGPVGRYQMVTSSQPDGTSSTFILDTKNGAAWKLRENDFLPIPLVRPADQQKLEFLQQPTAKIALMKHQKGLPLNQEEKEALIASIKSELHRRGAPIAGEDTSATPRGSEQQSK